MDVLPVQHAKWIARLLHRCPVFSIRLLVSGHALSSPLLSTPRVVASRGFMMESASRRVAVLLLRVLGDRVVSRSQTSLQLKSKRTPPAASYLNILSRSSIRMQMPGPIMRQYAPEVERPVSCLPVRIWMETTVRMMQVELVTVQG